MSQIEIILPSEVVALGPVEAGFAHGFGVFETMCLDGQGRLLFWKAHWDRLVRAADHFGIKVIFGPDEVLSAIRQLVGQIGKRNHTIKISCIRGGRTFVYARPAFLHSNCFGLFLDETCRLNEHSLLAGYKTHNYMENILLMERARALGCYDLLRLNTEGYVAEGAISNVFWVKDCQLFTPSVATGLLPGVIRERLVESLNVKEGLFRLDAVLAADEVFLTNSSVGLLRVDWLLRGDTRVERSFRSGLAERIKDVIERRAELEHVYL